MKLIEFKGIHIPKNKITVGIDVTPFKPMDFYNVPLKYKDIPESEPIVSVGEEIQEGTLIAKPAGKFGVNIYSPVSGKVLNIFDKVTSWGEYCKHILIANDKKNESVLLPEIESFSDITLISRLKEAGMVDTIANMPSFLKYSFLGTKSYKTLLILMDDLNPNCTVNQTLAEYKMEEVINGAKYFMNITSASHITFVFSDANRPLAKKLKQHIAETKKNYDYTIKFIPNRFPFANPYIMTYLVTGKRINNKTSFLDSGITIETAESCYNFCRAVEFNKPVTKKIITIDGDNIIRRGNYSIPNGVSYDSIIDFAGILEKDETIKIIEGNLMTGKAQYNKEISVTLTTDSIIIQKYNEFAHMEEFNCVSCGKCQFVCPMGLNPQKLETAYLEDDADELDKLKIQSCIECGCCSYVCPSRRNITQRILDAKYYTRINKGGK